MLSTVSVLFILGNARAVTLGQIDDFQDGTTQGWIHGNASPDPPSNIADGGPGGVGDNYLQVKSNGVGGAGSRLVAFNESQWIGDYLSAGVTSIAASVNNLGQTDLNLRFVLGGGTSFTYYVTSDPIALPSGSGWQDITFDLSSTGVTVFSGPDSYEDVFSTVSHARIISNPLLEFRGEIIDALLGIDNISANGSTRDGDFDFDDDVDGNDFLIWQRGNSPNGIPSGDLGLWQSNYGTPLAVAQNAVPEPSCTILLLGVVLGLLPHRGQR
ncbi:hypothetical protein [Bythopirellula polymerisocia]|uniref:hypothetical protein n=1 Tax=Bythopirellula polymerisocia TaxID=2528003 RepID=UPI0011B5EFF1|nr:hypothetical protein [Bythopirellula polymerisocia]